MNSSILIKIRRKWFLPYFRSTSKELGDWQSWATHSRVASSFILLGSRWDQYCVPHNNMHEHFITLKKERLLLVMLLAYIALTHSEWMREGVEIQPAIPLVRYVNSIRLHPGESVIVICTYSRRILLLGDKLTVEFLRPDTSLFVKREVLCVAFQHVFRNVHQVE